MPPLTPAQILVVIPAFNEELSVGTVIDEVRRHLPLAGVVVVDDGSLDATAHVARAHGAEVLSLPCNLGVGGAVQAGFQYALARNFHYVVRVDADGQHPPAEIPKLLATMERSGADLVIGSRFGSANHYVNNWFRQIGIRALALFLTLICRNHVTDPTSGFWLLNRKLLHYFAADYPADYPEPEAIALLCRQGYSFAETCVQFRPRTQGQSTIGAWDTWYYIFKVGLALVIDRIRPVNTRLSRTRVEEHYGTG